MARILLFVIVMLMTVPAIAGEKKPNVLFIAVDDLRPEFGYDHSPQAKTPNIDRLAAEGILFRNHFCTTSLCSPSRASI